MPSSSTVIIESEDTLSVIIRYGLYLGAAFQLVCLLACIFLPDLNHSSNHFKLDTDDDSSEQSVHNTPKKPQHKNRKQDKKKRR